MESRCRIRKSALVQVSNCWVVQFALDLGHGHQFGHWNLPESVRSPGNLASEVVPRRLPAIEGTPWTTRTGSFWDTYRACSALPDRTVSADVSGGNHDSRTFW